MSQLVTVSHEGRDFAFRAHKGCSVARRMAQYGSFYEAGMLAFIQRNAWPGIYIDAGAFIGTHSVFFSECCPACERVMAYEPMEASYRLLTANLGTNCQRGIHAAFPFALGASIGPCVIGAGRAENRGMASITQEAGQHADMTTIDARAGGLSGKVALIKIDVEGYELEVVKGAEETIRKHNPQLFIECNDTNILSIMSILLKGWGYARGRVFNCTPTWRFEPREGEA